MNFILIHTGFKISVKHKEKLLAQLPVRLFKRQSIMICGFSNFRILRDHINLLSLKSENGPS